MLKKFSIFRYTIMKNNISILKRSFTLFSVFCFIGLFSTGVSAKTDQKDGPLKKGAELKMKKNPFFSKYNTPFNVPPFNLIKENHYKPAFKKGMEDHKKEVGLIANNTKPATFENTIEALEKSGELLSNVSRVFFSLNSSLTNKNMQDIAKYVSPLLSKHNDDINLNEDLFKRVKSVYDSKDDLKLTTEQAKLLDEFYKGFVRGGANLSKKDKKKLRAINKKLSLSGLKFRQNVLAETNSFLMVLDKKEDLDGLPESVIEAAAIAAKSSGNEGKWVFTLHKPSWIPFLQYSTRRGLREKLYKGYINRGDNNNEFDNKKIISRIASLRVKKAKLMGYKTHSEFVLEENMAKKPENVYKLLDKLWEPALKMSKKDAKEMQGIIDKEGGKFKLKSWDWWYYSEKLRKAKFDLDEKVLRPYFKLENVIKGAFYVADKLYGIKFLERKDIPLYHEDVLTYEVQEDDGTHLGILYMDYFPRESKRGGAWCGSLRKHSIEDGKRIHPVVYMVLNASKPTGDIPALLSVDEASTLFHEFGHALHNLLSEAKYKSLSGTSVAGDFVELPSQIMENWAMHSDVLKFYAKHYKTGKSIPVELLEKLNKSKHFNQGFITLEYLAACYLDMNWHTLTDEKEVDTDSFEKSYFKKIGLIPEIISRYRSTYFNHIIGGYDSGYYYYIWAEVLDADAFDAFVEKGIFDKATAKAFRDNILAKGGSEDPMVLYKRFRGTKPKINALLKKRGLYSK
ncbi:MAG: M3 family metallopeptidase [Acidobacteriota bacterium]